MLSSLRQDIFDIPMPQLGPETWAPPSEQLRQLMTPQFQASVPPAPDTITGWLNRNQSLILIVSALLFGLVLLSRLAKR